MRQRALACLLIFVIIAVLFPINAYGASLLKYGSRGNEVEKLQQQLIKLGYLKGKADGIFGPQTQAAVIKFQKDYKLKQDGIVGPATRGKLSEAMAALQNGGGSPPPSNGGGSSNNKLPITTTLKMGSRGSQVQVLQKRLNELGFNCGAVDGIFGNKTHNAVVQFQKARGLTANGIVDTKTVEKLFEASGGTPPSNGGGSGGNTQLPITTTLKMGSRGSQVQVLQKRLNELGFNCGAVDGIFGNKTHNAVVQFQKARGLTANGIVDTKTVEKLFEASGGTPPSNGGGSGGNTQLPITTTLKMGSRGSQVQVLQKRLNELGFNCGAVDGIFGNKTHNAVVQFQKARGLTANGIVDTKTVEKLFEASGGTPPSNGGGSGGNTQLPITTTLKMGSRGSQVQVLQKRLNELGFNCGAVDGIFGNKTHNAVVQFQKARGLTANGIVDTKTVEKLFSDGPSQEPEPEPDPDPDTGFKQFHGTPGTLAGKTIFVDAGHGGVDSGATRNGVMEKTLVLDMALRLKRILEEAGAKVILTRPDDKFYSLHYRSAYVNSYILNNELSELNKERNDAVSERDAKQAEVDNKAQEIIQKEADISSYTAELEAKEAYLSQLETQKNELDRELTSARDDYENKEMAYNEKYAEYKPGG